MNSKFSSIPKDDWLLDGVNHGTHLALTERIDKGIPFETPLREERVATLAQPIGYVAFEEVSLDLAMESAGERSWPVLKRLARLSVAAATTQLH